MSAQERTLLTTRRDCPDRLVPVGDPTATAAALDEVLAAAPELGRAARAHCLQRFSLDAIADRYAELLAHVHATGRRRPRSPN